MVRFEFKNKAEAFKQGRGGFANMVCRLLYLQNDKDLDKAIKEGESIFHEFEEHVRNIYELIEDSIPLIAYYQLKKYGADDLDLDEEKYTQALYKCKKACDDYYA
jgi:hypothetical protein